MRTIEALSKADYPALVEAAKADNHCVLGPTHILRKDGRIIGYAGKAPAPLMFWSHTQNSPFDTFRFLRFAIAQMGGAHWTTCDLASPLYRFMGELGYERFGNADLFVHP